ncbi:MAG: hypothetical protein Q7S80_03190, partial [bacterium]|nr:hypothetical protein [bacterium]
MSEAPRFNPEEGQLGEQNIISETEREAIRAKIRGFLENNRFRGRIQTILGFSVSDDGSVVIPSGGNLYIENPYSETDTIPPEIV